VVADLSVEDAATAYRAMARLIKAPEQTVALLERVSPVQPKERVRVQALVASLDDEDFGKREKATREPERLGGAAERSLRSALGETSSLEVRKRASALLGRIERLGGARLHLLRVIEVLEHLGTPAAERVLRKLAGGAQAPETDEAKAALNRLRMKRGTGH
jgi:hypothetical protein